MKNWDNVVLVPEFDEQGVACYRLEGGDYENEYYVISCLLYTSDAADD